MGKKKTIIFRKVLLPQLTFFSFEMSPEYIAGENLFRESGQNKIWRTLPAHCTVLYCTVLYFHFTFTVLPFAMAMFAGDKLRHPPATF